jgi:hypothetical protein
LVVFVMVLPGIALAIAGHPRAFPLNGIRTIRLKEGSAAADGRLGSEVLPDPLDSRWLCLSRL